jgi:hypothetical protein
MAFVEKRTAELQDIFVQEKYMAWLRRKVKKLREGGALTSKEIECEKWLNKKMTSRTNSGRLCIDQLDGSIELFDGCPHDNLIKIKSWHRSLCLSAHE